MAHQLKIDAHMCGIIGYIGQRSAVPVLVEGLRKLEYRGYDSAGIAVVRGSVVSIRRQAGKLSNLEDVIRLDPIVGGEYGIGHTRWATHGRPTEQNAHPHRDCTGKIVVVHNGIIENYLELKQQLQSEGHQFVTETDTEVVAHLVEREMMGDGLEQALRRALRPMRGLFALVLISTDDPGKIVTVRNGPPIVIGLGHEEFFVASDIPAILSHTRDVVFLGDNETAVVTRDGVTFRDVAGRPVPKASERVLWDPRGAEKGGHEHFMIKEIFEQPAAARETFVRHVSQDTGRVHLEGMKLADEQLASIDRVTVLACGTSWHAGLVGKYMIERLARVPVEVDYGSEYRYRDPIVSPHALAVVITQSGETADTLAALRQAKRGAAASVAICNVVGSMATRETDGTIYTHAGPEIGVASTKAFTTQLIALYLLGLRMGAARGVLSAADCQKHVDRLAGLPQLLERTLKLGPAIGRVARQLHSRTDFLYLGRGINYPIALEGALKLKEISYIHAEGYPAGEMKHGPIALIDKHMPVVAIAPRGAGFEKMAGNIQEIKARSGSVIAVTTEGDTQLMAMLDPATDVILEVPDAPELIVPILMALPLQLLAYHIAVRRGCDVDQPRNLAKSVTVE
jgi:glutamine---fructose-6-phosphate transaminase (isomerizing)